MKWNQILIPLAGTGGSATSCKVNIRLITDAVTAVRTPFQFIGRVKVNIEIVIIETLRA